MPTREGVDSLPKDPCPRHDILDSLRVVTAALNPTINWALLKEAGYAWMADNAASTW
jgi:hypothetical protein